MIIDTDIIIWFFRKNENAVTFIKNNYPFNISVVTSMEIMQGMKNKKELTRSLKMFQFLNINIIYINEEISLLAEKYVKQYGLSHSMKLADALIAATSRVYNKTLYTCNYKHYHFVPNLNVQCFRP